MSVFVVLYTLFVLEGVDINVVGEGMCVICVCLSSSSCCCCVYVYYG